MEIPPELLEAQNALVSMVMGIPGVRGVDVGLREDNGVITDEIILRVLVADLANIPPGIPPDISGIPVSIIERNPEVEVDLTRYSPLVGGSSISNRLTSGTLGGIARENNTGELRGVTNQHVLGSDGVDEIFQPELTTLPPPAADRIGTLIRTSFPTTPSVLPPFKPIGFTDAACFSIGRAAAAEVEDIGPVLGSAVAQLNDRVMKRGKTTLLTHGIVTGIGAYENRGSVLVNQIEVTVDSNLSPQWSASGDSGSLVIKESTGEVVGLHWGSDSGIFGYASDIETTAAELGISFFWPIPQVSSVSPSQCQSQGGDQVIIDGLGFQLASSVLFGGVPALSFEVQNDHQIMAVAPPGNGVVTVIVTAPGGASDPMISASIAYF
jgi:hypothetical protein